jgi:rubrerythrin
MIVSRLERRRLLTAVGAGLAGSAAGVLVACGSGGEGGAEGGGGGSLTDKTTVLQPQGTGGSADVAILNSSLDLENMAVAAYEAVAPALRGDAGSAARRLLEQEREHADGLANAVRQLGGTANRPRASYDFPSLRTRAKVLRFAAGIENTAIAAYIDSLPRLSSPDLRGMAAAILTDEAEHLSVLLGVSGRPQLTGAFVRGTD